MIEKGVSASESW